MTKILQEDEDKKAITEALTQLFSRVLALESALIEQKLITPQQLAESNIRTMTALKEFQDKELTEMKEEK